ncbi:MAG: FAD binding domain-containing protein [Candidatus Heimdallarchaeota archaeon]
MLRNLKNHLYPQSIEETISLLQRPNSRILAGGTALTLSRDQTTDTLIDLQGLGLSYIKEKEDCFIIGAMTSAYDIYRHEKLPKSLRTGARRVGDTALLHAVTIGGNLARLYEWVDLPPVLWALDASVSLYESGKRTLSAKEFFEYSRKKNVYRRQALITEVEVKKLPERSYSEYQSLTLTKNEKAQLNLASFFSWDSGGLISEVRLVLGAATSYPVRLPIEKAIVGRNLTNALIDDCASRAAEGISLSNDYKSSIEYRRQILGIYLKRTLKKCHTMIKVE